MHFLLRAAAIASTLIFVAPAAATAAPVKLPDVSRAVTTFDRYELTALLTDQYINSVPNMAATTFTREAFLSGVAWQTFVGSTEPVTGGKLSIWIMMGCQIDLSDGGYIATSPSVGLADIVGNFEDFAAGISGLGPQLSMHMNPGTITYQKLKEKVITETMAQEINKSGQGLLRIAVTDAHVKVDSCGGPVSVRMGVTAQLSTKNSDDESNAYGEILSI